MSYKSMERKFKYLINKRVIWRRDPITDIPDEETKQYLFYKDGTYQAYNLFRSKAKITTYRSLKWHMLTLWYLNSEWDEDEATDIAMFLTDKYNGFITFTINKWNVNRLINDLSIIDLDVQPTNKLRKIIFKWNCGLTKTEKLSIVGKLIGRMNGVKKEDLYEAMIQTNHEGSKIIISKLAEMMNVTTRTIHRNMCSELKQVKKELNEEINI